ncbi:uncharacterized protein LOC135123560 isoform X4 [Zophobas morio]
MLIPSTRDQWMKDFLDRWQFPFCCGAIDEKHVLIQNPPHGASDYYNYKDVGINGRMNGSHIWEKKTFYSALASNNLELPNKADFIGDDAFPLTINLMKRCSRHEGLEYKQKLFNYRLPRARRIVEYAFGIIASGFRVYRKPISVSLDKTDSITKATCALHNWLRTNRIYMNTPELIDEQDFSSGTIREGSWRSIPVEEVVKIITPLSSNNYSRNAKDLRDRFGDYFVGPGRIPWQDRMIV